MPTYVALLRGINVGGNSLRMDRLRALFDGLGLQRVRTYIQSGNVVFDAVEPPARWRERIERSLEGQTRLPVSFVLRSAAQLARIIDANPFLASGSIDRTKLHVVFLSGRAPKRASALLGGIPAGTDQFRVGREEIYLHCPNGFARSRLGGAPFERLLGLTATIRNWNTVTELYHLACA